MQKIVKTVSVIIILISMYFAEVPLLVNYPGKLSEKNGNPITGTKSIKFSLFDSETGGSLKWNGTYAVTVNKGVFNILLGSGSSTFPGKS